MDTTKLENTIFKAKFNRKREFQVPSGLKDMAVGFHAGFWAKGATESCSYSKD